MDKFVALEGSDTFMMIGNRKHVSADEGSQILEMTVEILVIGGELGELCCLEVLCPVRKTASGHSLSNNFNFLRAVIYRS